MFEISRNENLINQLNDENFEIIAAHYYNNPGFCGIKEFYDDLNRLKYLKRLFKRFIQDSNDLKERLILNHLIIIFNVFGIVPAKKLIIFKLREEPEMLEIVKPFIAYLNYLEPSDSDWEHIPPNSIAEEKLREI